MNTAALAHVSHNLVPSATTKTLSMHKEPIGETFPPLQLTRAEPRVCKNMPILSIVVPLPMMVALHVEATLPFWLVTIPIPSVPITKLSNSTSIACLLPVLQPTIAPLTLSLRERVSINHFIAGTSTEGLVALFNMELFVDVLSVDQMTTELLHILLPPLNRVPRWKIALLMEEIVSPVPALLPSPATVIKRRTDVEALCHAPALKDRSALLVEMEIGDAVLLILVWSMTTLVDRLCLGVVMIQLSIVVPVVLMRLATSGVERPVDNAAPL